MEATDLATTDRDATVPAGVDTDAMTGTAQQAALPFDHDVADAAGASGGADRPIPFALTARARRAVAPDQLPALEVLPVPSEDPDDPHDTRSARARALRRAGVGVEDIAAELVVDDLLVRAWTRDVAPVHSARRRLHAVGATPRAGSGGGRPVQTAEERRQRELREHARFDGAFAHARDAAAGAAADRVRDDAGFAAGLGLLAGMSEVGPHAVVITTDQVARARAVLGWLGDAVTVDPARVKIVLRVAPQVAADRAIHDWAGELGLPLERFTHTTWRAAPDADAVEAMIRVADPAVAGTVAGWCDALIARVGARAATDAPAF